MRHFGENLHYRQIKMSEKNVVRIPMKWGRIEREILTQNTIPELVDTNRLISWVKECNLADEALVTKYMNVIRPYHFSRLLFPILPDKDVCREAFAVFIEFVIVLYLCDDELEAKCNLNELEIVCSAYDFLDEKLKQCFPKIPSVEELRSFLPHVKKERLLALVVSLIDSVSRVVSPLLKYSVFPQESVFDFRCRFAHSLGYNLKGVLHEKKMLGGVSENKLLWRRIFEGAPITFLMYLEISSLSVTGSNKHIPIATEMYILSSLCCMVTNDVYSYHRECNEGLKVDNIISLWLHNKQIASVAEGVSRISRIVNSAVKYMLAKVKSMKSEYPNNFNVQTLTEFIALSSVGWLYMHDQGVPRYSDSPWRLNLVDIEESDINSWLAEKDPYADGVIDQFKYSNLDAKKFIDSLCEKTSVSEEQWND